MSDKDILTFVSVIALFWAWNMLLSFMLLRHQSLFDKARKRIALGLPPFPKAPDDGRDSYLDRMGIH